MKTNPCKKHNWLFVRTEKAGKLVRILWKCSKCGMTRFTQPDGGH